MSSAQSQVFHQSYVLHSRPYRETSVIVDLLHAGGRVSCVAKGVRGKRESLRKYCARLYNLFNLSLVLGLADQI